jgi:hypothetical protein
MINFIISLIVGMFYILGILGIALFIQLIVYQGSGKKINLYKILKKIFFKDM